MTGPQTIGTSGHGVQKSQRVWGHPNKHFCGAKMASVNTLALLAVSASGLFPCASPALPYSAPLLRYGDFPAQNDVLQILFGLLVGHGGDGDADTGNQLRLEPADGYDVPGIHQIAAVELVEMRR